jgi:hypothetical protein
MVQTGHQTAQNPSAAPLPFGIFTRRFSCDKIKNFVLNDIQAGRTVYEQQVERK